VTSRRWTAGLVLGLILGLSSKPALAQMPEAACEADLRGLGASLIVHLMARVDLWSYRGLPAEPDQIMHADDMMAAVSSRFGLTGHDERAIVYTQFDEGLCALILTADGIIAAAWGPDIDQAMIAEAQIALLAALDVETRMQARQAVPHARAAELAKAAAEDQPISRGAGSLDDAPPMQDRRAEAAAASERLAQLLMLSRLAPHLEGAGEVMIVPMFDLGTIPFALLPAGDISLFDIAPLTIVPSVHDLAGAGFSDMYTLEYAMEPMGFDGGWGRSFVLGDPTTGGDPDWSFPPLPGARQEATLVAESLGQQALLGEAATRSAFLAAAEGDVDLIYLAAHGIASEEAPLEQSFIALADGRLTAGEILQLRLSSNPLVVLSACQSGLGRSHSGGTVGLTRSFVIAGASAVVSSLWNVDDRATETLMRDFLQETASDRPAVALWKAMHAARDRYPDDPALWAGFVHFGTVSAFLP